MKWMVVSAKYASGDLAALLDDGWEPFAVASDAVGPGNVVTLVYLKKVMDA